MFDRRHFLKTSLAAGSAAAIAGQTAWAAPAEVNFAFGLVTYMWGADWDLPTLLANCQKAGVRGVELRTTHKHGVEPSLAPAMREQVARQFADSGVTLVGLGSNEKFDHPDPAKLAAAIAASKAFLQLSHDLGSTGVKVKPDGLPPNVPREKTIEQIGTSLNQLGEFAEGLGQQVRLEVHGQCAELPTIKAILDVADHPAVAICWNCNPTDLAGDGLEANFRLVEKRLGETLHIHELDADSQKEKGAIVGYPYDQLFPLLVKAGYTGWALLEAGSRPANPVAALQRQRELFEAMVARLAAR